MELTRNGAKTSLTNPQPTVAAANRFAPLTGSSRTVTAADTITSPTCVDQLAAGATVITLATTNLYGGIAAGTAYGTNACGVLSAAFTPTENRSVVMTVALPDGAEYADLFLSVDAAPKWVARATRALIEGGCSVTAVGTVVANATVGAGKVDIQVVGTGAVSTAARFASTVATIAVGKSTIETIDCTGYPRAYVYAEVEGGALAATPTMTIIPFSRDPVTLRWNGGTPATITPGTASEPFVVDVGGDPAFRIGVKAITAGATGTISVVLGT